MRTFLQLCEVASRESGAVGRAPTAVTGQTGRQEKVVNWVIDAWREIQNMRDDWFFMRADWGGTLTPRIAKYDATGFAIQRFGWWLVDRPNYRPTTIYDTAIGQKDESHLNLITYERWKTSYDRGQVDNNRPIHYAVSPSNQIIFAQPPDKAYMVRGEYRKVAQVLAANDDIPDLPQQFHDVIAYRAIMLMALHDESPPGLEAAKSRYAGYMFDMQRTQLPQFETDTEPPIDQR